MEKKLLIMEKALIAPGIKITNKLDNIDKSIRELIVLVRIIVICSFAHSAIQNR